MFLSLSPASFEDEEMERPWALDWDPGQQAPVSMKSSLDFDLEGFHLDSI